MTGIIYIFYYYWSSDLRPCPAKGVKDAGHTIGANNIIKGAEWEISTTEYINTPLSKLVEKFPWPFGEGKDA